MKRYIWLLCLLSACREAPEGFVAPDPFDELGAANEGRLTWNIYGDHTPAWNASSDSVYYSARSYPGFPETGGLLLKLPRAPGRAGILLQSLQENITPTPWLAAPAPSPDRQSIAFVELTDVYDLSDCNAGVSCALPPITQPQPDTTAGNALLIAGVLRVRPLQGGGQEARIPIQFSEPGNNRIAHPFQRQYERDGAEIFRPSWSPDGSRLVYSDGLQLYIWSVGAGSAAAIPNTEDGVWPAWSPDGQTIAFTKLQRNGADQVLCFCNRQGRPRPIFEINRTVYNDGGGRVGSLMTIRPDGTQLMNLGVGDAPAWSPNGQTLVFNRNNQLYRSAPDGSNATPINNTNSAFEPAISPNGQWLSFSRDRDLDERADYDIWVVAF